MANARKLDKRRKSIRNIRKITRTMELIATARFKKAMDRAAAATDYTRRITKVVADLARAGLEVTHPLLEPRAETKNATLLVLTANRGLCGGYNGNVLRQAVARKVELEGGNSPAAVRVEASGKRGISGLKFRKVDLAEQYTQFDDKPAFDEVDAIASRYLDQFISGGDRPARCGLHAVHLDQPPGSGRRNAVAARPAGRGPILRPPRRHFVGLRICSLRRKHSRRSRSRQFKVKLFKCFLDAAVSEQISRMVAMKNATKSASDMIKDLSRTYNRARQSQITGEIMEVIGGVEALSG